MIKNGNYYFLNMAMCKDQLIEAFTEYFGEQHREAITEKIGTMGYYPHLNEEFITDYYNQFLALFRKDIIEEYKKGEGLEEISEDLENFVMNEEGKSGFLSACREGENLDEAFYIDKELREHLIECREKACKLLGIEKDNFDELLAHSKRLEKYIRNVQEKNKCDVFNDIELIENNRATLLQMFLRKVANSVMYVSERDDDNINMSDFSWLDSENLDCNYMLFHKYIDSPGLVASFSTQSEEKLNNGSIEEKIKIVKDRLRYFVCQTKSPEKLSFVAHTELFGTKAIRDPQYYFERLVVQLGAYEECYPNLIVRPQTADMVEQLRSGYASNVYNGCKFIKNINKRIESHVHKPDGYYEHLTVMNYACNNKDMPIANIFFNESETCSVDCLLESLIHEVMHVISHGKAHETNYANVALLRDGVNNGYALIDRDNISLIDRFEEYVTKAMDIEENCVDRMALEVKEIFDRRFENVFEPSDITYSNQKDYTVAYHYWDFLTDKFYNAFHDHIKEHRINPKYDMFFPNKYLPINKTGRMLRDMEEKHLRRKAKRGKVLMPYGVMSYNNIERLAELVENFQEEVVPELYLHNVYATQMQDDNDNFRSLPLHTRLYMNELKGESDRIFDDMMADYESMAKPRMEQEKAILDMVKDLERQGSEVEFDDETKETIEYIKSKYIERHQDSAELEQQEVLTQVAIKEEMSE